MKNKWIKMYLDMAERVSQESHATRLKVGCVFVSENGVLSIGINGLPANGSNVCEDENNNTKPDVSHAEENLIYKLLKEGVSTKNGKIFITHSPCERCIRLLCNAGISEIYYLHEYRETTQTKKYIKEFFPNINLIHYKK